MTGQTFYDKPIYKNIKWKMKEPLKHKCCKCGALGYAFLHSEKLCNVCYTELKNEKVL